MSIYLRGETWHVDITPKHGKRIRESTGLTDKDAAQRYHDELRAKLWGQPKQSGLTWQDACVKWLKAADRSESDRYSIRALNYPNRPVQECTVESFEQALSDKSPATFNRYRALIVAILNHSGLKIKIPTKRVKTGRLRFLSNDEWQRLYKELPKHLKPLASFALATGMRQANVTGLRWNQVDLKRKVAWIHADESKSEKAIGIPLSDEAVQILQAQVGLSAEWVFPYKGRGRKQGQPLTKIKRAWQEALKRAQIEDFTWHGLRHTWASWHVMSGTPLEVLQKLGGWNDLRMVMRYTHLAPEYLAGYAGNAKPYVT
jgi:integrase